MKKVWRKSGNIFILGESSDLQDKLLPGIYRFSLDQFKNPFLENTADSFIFPHKVYGMEDKFIDRIKTTYGSTKGNMGILLNGTKGTGKTVTAKSICNMLNLPVILVTEKHDELIAYLNDFQQDVIVFIDEYEKYYNNYDNSLLTILDGVLSNNYRKFFILTTNDLHINRNLLQRPGRIRYIKTFSDLPMTTINEILDDLLKYPEHRDQCIKFISELSIITIDLIKSVIEEVNIHNESPYEFSDIFNTHSDEDFHYNIYKIIDGNPEPELFMEYVNMDIHPDKIKENTPLRLNNVYHGSVKAILPNNDLVVYKEIYDEEGDNIKGQEKMVFRITKNTSIHKLFRNPLAL